MGKKKTVNVNREHYLNDEPCIDPECSLDGDKSCLHCGRINRRGVVVIEDRVGNVHMERLWNSTIKRYLTKTIEEQQNSTLQLWRPPSTVIK